MSNERSLKKTLKTQFEGVFEELAGLCSVGLNFTRFVNHFKMFQMAVWLSLACLHETT